jgi:hypothetical protein
MFKFDQIESFRENYDLFRQKQSCANAGFFLVKRSNNKEMIIGSLSEFDTFFEGCDNDEVNLGLNSVCFN